MLLYLLLAGGAAVLGYELYTSTKPPQGNLGFMVIPAGVTILEPDGTLSTLQHDTPSSQLPPGSFVGGTGDYVVAADGSLGTYTAGTQVSKAVVLPAGTTVMFTDGTNSTMATDTSSASLPAGTAVFDDNRTYLVASDGSLHEAQLSA